MVQVFPAVVKLFVMVFGNTMEHHKTFLDVLMDSRNIRKVNNVDDCDVIIAFVAIVSRAGTDIEAALPKIPETRRVVLVVLHHTFDPEYIAPDSRLTVQRSNVFTVDCLFHEDQGLLRCTKNENALKDVKKHLGADDSVVGNGCAPCQPSENNKARQHFGKNRKVWLAVIFASVLVVLIVILATTLRS